MVPALFCCIVRGGRIDEAEGSYFSYKKSKQKDFDPL